MKLLQGKKTYLVALASMIYAGGIQQGWWPHLPLVDGLLAGGGLAALRKGVADEAKTPPATGG